MLFAKSLKTDKCAHRDYIINEYLIIESIDTYI